MSRLGSLHDERGITLLEVLLAIGVLGIGLAAVMAVVPVAVFAVQDGNQTTTATYLAQQRLEQIRNVVWDAAADCVGLSATATSAPTPVGACATSPTFPDELENTMEGFGQYARSVRIFDCGDVANLAACGNVTSSALRLVRVVVTYRPISAAGGSNANTSVTLEWLVAQRL